MKKNEMIVGSSTFVPYKTAHQLFGVPPKELKCAIEPFRNDFTVYKSSKKGTSSFRITKDLLESLFDTQNKIQKKPKLIITINDGSNEYQIICSITKTTKG